MNPSKKEQPNQMIPQGSTSSTESFRQMATEAIRYWEPRRIIYNLMLVAVVGIHFAVQLPDSKAFLSFDGIVFLFILAVLSNVAYCAAYLADIFAQWSGFSATWERYRWVLFTIGCLFAASLAHFFASGMFQTNG